MTNPAHNAASINSLLISLSTAVRHRSARDKSSRPQAASSALW